MRVFLSSLMLLLVAGCSSLTQLEKPQLSIVNVEVVKTDMWEQRLKVRLRVQNPNDRALPIRGLSYVVEVAGEQFAQGVSGESFTVPALGEAEFDMNVTANMASAIIKLMGRRDASTSEVPYRLKGKVSLSEGFLRSIPFEEKGSFRLR